MFWKVSLYCGIDFRDFSGAMDRTILAPIFLLFVILVDLLRLYSRKYERELMSW